MALNFHGQKLPSEQPSCRAAQRVEICAITFVGAATIIV